MSFPRGHDTGTRNVLRLLRGYLRPGLRCVEVGCAPGKILAWAGRATGVTACGIDYSPTGAETARWLCAGLGVEADVRCEDATRNSFPPGSFDLAFSCGLVEHFEDPSAMIAAHVDLVAPGGCALIAIPNYSGLYLRFQRFLDPPNLAIHNLDLMRGDALLAFAPARDDVVARCFRYGSFSPWLLSLSKRFGRTGHMASWAMNAVALLQPVEIAALCPLIVLEIRRAPFEPAVAPAAR